MTLPKIVLYLFFSSSYQCDAFEGVDDGTKEQRQLGPIGDISAFGYRWQIMAHYVDGGDVAGYDEGVRYRG